MYRLSTAINCEFEHILFTRWSFLTTNPACLSSCLVLGRMKQIRFLQIYCCVEYHQEKINSFQKKLIAVRLYRLSLGNSKRLKHTKIYLQVACPKENSTVCIHIGGISDK